MISEKIGKPIDIASQERCRERLAKRFTMMLGMVLGLRLLHGRVARLHVCYNNLKRDFEVLEAKTDRHQAMALWRRYGFGWGPDEK